MSRGYFHILSTSLFSQYAALHNYKVYPSYQQRLYIKHKHNAATASCITATATINTGISLRGM